MLEEKYETFAKKLQPACRNCIKNFLQNILDLTLFREKISSLKVFLDSERKKMGILAKIVRTAVESREPFRRSKNLKERLSLKLFSFGFERKIFQTFSKIFRRVCQNCILRVNGKILRLSKNFEHVHPEMPYSGEKKSTERKNLLSYLIQINQKPLMTTTRLEADDRLLPLNRNSRQKWIDQPNLQAATTRFD